MRIQHNISALNANRQLAINDSSISKNLKRLSSGYRINSAADDAAGLAISEKMRSQINGLDQAENNAQDGISLVQTAEGGLNETTSILQRMNTLATESSNGTYQDGTDRSNLQDEITELTSEVDRIASSTNFNKINLLDGSLSGSSASGARGTSAATVELSTTAESAHAFGMVNAVAGKYDSKSLSAAASTASGTGVNFTANYSDGNGSKKSVSVNLLVNADHTKLIATDGTEYGIVTPTAAATSGDVAKAVIGELNKTDLKGSFSIANNGTDGIELTAKTAGTSGAKITGFTEESVASSGDVTNDTQAMTVVTKASDAYQTTDATKLSAWDGTNASDAVFTVNGGKFAFVASGADTSKLDSGINFVQLKNGSNIDSASVNKMSTLINQKTGLATDTSGTTATIGASILANKWDGTSGAGEITTGATQNIYTIEGEKFAFVASDADTSTFADSSVNYVKLAGAAITSADRQAMVDKINSVASATVASDTSAAISDVSAANVWDGTTSGEATASIYTIDGQKFAFVSSTATSVDDSNINYVKIAGATITKGDATAMATKLNSVLSGKGTATGNATAGTVDYVSAGLDYAPATNIDYKAAAGSTTSNKGGLLFQIGSDDNPSQQVSLTIGDMSSSGLGIDKVSVGSQKDAQKAITTIKTAINTVSSQRATLGAMQNRLEHTVNNLSTTSQNLTSAESRIRDVDMSSEMVSLTKNQILEQAATAMLSQANSLPQNVLSLLK